MRATSGLFWIVPLTLMVSGALAADLTRAEVEATLAAASPGHGASFAGRSLAGLDLQDLDFTGVDFSGADLSEADLRGTKLVAENVDKLMPKPSAANFRLE